MKRAYLPEVWTLKNVVGISLKILTLENFYFITTETILHQKILLSNKNHYIFNLNI